MKKTTYQVTTGCFIGDVEMAGICRIEQLLELQKLKHKDGTIRRVAEMRPRPVVSIIAYIRPSDGTEWWCESADKLCESYNAAEPEWSQREDGLWETEA